MQKIRPSSKPVWKTILLSVAIAGVFGTTITTPLISQVNASTVTSQTTSSQTSQITPAEGYTWNKTRLLVYIDPNIDAVYQTAYQQAIAAWNNVGVLTLVQTQNQSSANVVLSTKANGTSTEIGGCYYSYIDDSFVETTHCYIYTNNFESSSDTTAILSVAEHELGHAMGLDHNTSDSNSVMQPASGDNLIDANDIAGLKAIYDTASSASTAASSVESSSVSSSSSSESSSPVSTDTDTNQTKANSITSSSTSSPMEVVSSSSSSSSSSSTTAAASSTTHNSLSKSFHNLLIKVQLQKIALQHQLHRLLASLNL